MDKMHILILQTEFRDATHTKLAVEGTHVTVTFGKLNSAGHYRPIKNYKKGWQNQVLHDGVGWKLSEVNEAVILAMATIQKELAYARNVERDLTYRG
jgi:hypothetical protein